MASKQIWISTPDPSQPPGSTYVRKSITLVLGEPVSLKRMTVFDGDWSCFDCGVGNPCIDVPPTPTTETYRWDGGSQFTLVRIDHFPAGDRSESESLDLDHPSFTTRDYRP